MKLYKTNAKKIKKVLDILEKEEKKYGEPYLRGIANDSRHHIISEFAYDGYKESHKRAKRNEVEAWICYSLSLAIVVAAYWFPSFLITGVVFLILGATAGVNARIERLWMLHFTDELFNRQEIDLIYDRIEKKKNKKK